MKRTPLKKVSRKRAKELKVYSELRKLFLSARQYCEIFVDGCTRRATELHHVNGRNGRRLLDTQWFLPSCRNCHRYLHDNPRFARENGFLK